MSAPRLSWSAAAYAAAAIGLRFAALAVFTFIAPRSTLAVVLWATAVSQLAARVVDAGLPSLLRIASYHRLAQRAVAAWQVWLVYAMFIGLGAAGVITLFKTATWSISATVPSWMMALHCTSVALNNMVLQLQFSAERSVGIAWTLLAPPLLPLLIGASTLAVYGNGFSAADRLFLAYVAGDLALTLGSFVALLRGRFGHMRSPRLRLLWRVLRRPGILRFIGAAWFAGLVKTMGQKTERLFAVALLSADAYIAVSYVLAARDALANVSGLSLYRRFNAVLRGQEVVDGARLQTWTWPVLGIASIGATALWAALAAGLEYIPVRPFESAAALMAILVAGVIPFLHVNLVAQMSTALRTQRVNLACQVSMVLSMCIGQALAWSSGWVPFIGTGPFLAASVVGLLAARWSRVRPSGL